MFYSKWKPHMHCIKDVFNVHEVTNKIGRRAVLSTGLVVMVGIAEIFWASVITFVFWHLCVLTTIVLTLIICLPCYSLLIHVVILMLHIAIVMYIFYLIQCFCLDTFLFHHFLFLFSDSMSFLAEILKCHFFKKLKILYKTL